MESIIQTMIQVLRGRRLLAKLHVDMSETEFKLNYQGKKQI
ncbi:hypothetical protein V7075_17035 [Neobacillus drentensis]